MFKKKKDIVPPMEYEPPKADAKLMNEIETLKLLNELNESNKTLGKIDNAEYESTKQFIINRCNELENSFKFDNMMGNPMDALEGLFHD